MNMESKLLTPRLSHEFEESMFVVVAKQKADKHLIFNKMYNELFRFRFSVS